MPPSPIFSSRVYWPSCDASRTCSRRPKIDCDATVEIATAPSPNERRPGSVHGTLGRATALAGVPPRARRDHRQSTAKAEQQRAPRRARHQDRAQDQRQGRGQHRARVRRAGELAGKGREHEGRVEHRHEQRCPGVDREQPCLGQRTPAADPPEGAGHRCSGQDQEGAGIASGDRRARRKHRERHLLDHEERDREQRVDAAEQAQPLLQERPRLAAARRRLERDAGLWLVLGRAHEAPVYGRARMRRVRLRELLGRCGTPSRIVRPRCRSTRRLHGALSFYPNPCRPWEASLRDEGADSSKTTRTGVRSAAVRSSWLTRPSVPASGRQLTVCRQHFAQTDERTHDRDVDLRCPFAPQHARQHRYALLGKRERQVAPAATAGAFEIADCDLKDANSVR